MQTLLMNMKKMKKRSVPMKPRYAAWLLLAAAACNSSETITTVREEFPTTKVLEYTPAPGQFINSSLAGFPSTPITSPEEAAAYASARLTQGGTPDSGTESVTYGFVSLGGWGGYIILGFDEPVPSSGGTEYELYVTGNAFNGSSEPGIVSVAQDADGDGSPAGETWYELKGSEYDASTHGYEITYTAQTDGTVAWSDNRGGSGTIDRTIHTQSYIPAWVDRLTYTGSRLPDNVTFDETSNKYVMRAFAWGYADNASTIDGSGTKNRFRISNAVDTDGNPANLAQIDFIRIQTGVNGKAEGGVGELSTEVCGVGCYRTVTRTE